MTGPPSQRREAVSAAARHLSVWRVAPDPLQDCVVSVSVGMRLPFYAARNTCSRLIFQAIVTSDHSSRALAHPRMLIWRQPITRLMIPNTGSTVCLRSPYSALPAFVASRWANLITGSSVSGAGPSAAKRWSTEIRSPARGATAGPAGAGASDAPKPCRAAAPGRAGGGAGRWPGPARAGAPGARADPVSGSRVGPWRTRLPAMPPSPVEPLRLVEPLAVPADGLCSPDPVRLFVGFERQPEAGAVVPPGELSPGVTAPASGPSVDGLRAFSEINELDSRTNV